MAITTAIILSLVMLVIASVSSSSSLASRMNEADAYAKKTSYFLARSCIERALLQLAQDDSYAGNQVIAIGSDRCTVKPVETSGANTIVKTQGQFASTTTNLKLTIASSDLSVVLLEEVASF